jgi:hypothetical protein
MADIWVTEHDLCDECGTLLDDLGICPACGYDGYDYDEDEDDFYIDFGDYDERAYHMGEYDEDEEEAEWEAIVSKPRVIQVLRAMADEVLRQDEAGETVEGGFDCE